MQIRTCVTFVLAFALCLIACSKRDSRELISEGYVELNGGDPERALRTFDSALSSLSEAQRAFRIDAVLGKCAALAQLDEVRAAKEFVSLADREDLSLANYSTLVIALKDEGHYREALNLLEHGAARFPDEPRFKALVQKIGEIADAGDDEALAMLEQLKRLGYVGNED